MLNRVQHFTESITQLIPAGVGQKLLFQEQPNLEKCWILGIEAFTIVQLAVDAQNRPVITAADSLRAMVSFMDRSADRIRRMPYTSLVAALNAGAVRQFDALEVNWPKSFIEFGVQPATLPSVAVFNVHYIPRDQAERLGYAFR